MHQSPLVYQTEICSGGIGSTENHGLKNPLGSGTSTPLVHKLTRLHIFVARDISRTLYIYQLTHTNKTKGNKIENGKTPKTQEKTRKKPHTNKLNQNIFYVNILFFIVVHCEIVVY